MAKVDGVGEEGGVVGGCWWEIGGLGLGLVGGADAVFAGGEFLAGEGV